MPQAQPAPRPTREVGSGSPLSQGGLLARRARGGEAVTLGQREVGTVGWIVGEQLPVAEQK